MADRETEREHLWVAESAERLGVGETKIREWFDDGTLKGFKIPGSGYRRITRESVERLRREMRGESE